MESTWQLLIGSIAIVLAIAFVVLFFVIIYFLYRGYVIVGGSKVYRNENALVFWVGMALFGVCGVAALSGFWAAYKIAI